LSTAARHTSTNVKLVIRKHWLLPTHSTSFISWRHAIWGRSLLSQLCTVVARVSRFAFDSATMRQDGRTLPQCRCRSRPGLRGSLGPGR